MIKLALALCLAITFVTISIGVAIRAASPKAAQAESTFDTLLWELPDGTIAWSVTLSDVDAPGILDVEIYHTTSNTKIHQVWANFPGTTPGPVYDEPTRTLHWAGTVSGLEPDHLTLKIGVFEPLWLGLRYWNDNAFTLDRTPATPLPPHALFTVELAQDWADWHEVRREELLHTIEELTIILANHTEARDYYQQIADDLKALP